MKCFRCGSDVEAGARFCSKCGGMVSDPAAATVAAGPGHDPLLLTAREALAPEYEVDRELGRGGMAVVFKATERELHRTVALKVLPPEMSMVPSIGERFKREARLAAALDHPNIIDIYRVGERGKLSFIAMRFVEGSALDEIIGRQGALPLPAILIVLRGAIGALAFAHERGTIHRDIKGGNILVDRDGRITVTDFGIARAMEETSLTASGAVIGTPTFMSPEQCAGRPLGPQCDQYAIGVVAYQMLTGSVPFQAESVIGLMHHHFNTPAPDVRQLRSGVPAELLDVVTRALAKKPEQRYATTAEMLLAVEAIPLPDGDRRYGESVLRKLARGERVGTISIEAITVDPNRPEPTSAAPTLPPRAVAPPPQAAPIAGRGYTAPMPAAPVTRRYRWLLPLVLALVLFAGAGGIYQWRFSPDAEMRRGAALYRAGRPDAARARFQRAARLRPALAQPHLQLAAIAHDQRDYVTAGRELEIALRLEPRNARALRQMGMLLLATGRYEPARVFLQRSLREDATDRASWGYLGCTMIRLGRVEAGRRMIARAGSGGWNACAHDAGG